MDVLMSMRIFQKVAEKLSFKAAADHFQLSPTAISKQIAALEDRLGSALLIRTTRRVQLTETGREYLERCRRILDDLSETESFVRDSTGTPQGLLRLGAPLGFGIKHLAPTLVKFQIKYPKVKVEVNFSDRIENPMETGYDITLRITKELKDSSLVAVKLGEIGVVVVASPEYIAKHGTLKFPEDLTRHNVFTYSNSAKPGFINLQTAKGELSIPVSGQLSTNSTLAIVPQLVSGRGVAQLPRFYVSEELKKGKLIDLFPRYRSPQYYLWAIMPPSGLNSLRAKAFLNFLREEFDNQIW